MQEKRRVRVEQKRMKRIYIQRISVLCGLVTLSAWWIGRQVQQARLDRNLLEAIKTDVPQQVKFWLDAGANPNLDCPQCETNVECIMAGLQGHYRARPILLSEAYHGHSTIVACLLDKGANALARDTEGSTSLMWAAQQGHTELVKLLLTRGTPIEARDAEGNTALFRSLWSGNPATVEALLHAGAETRATNDLKETTLLCAVESAAPASILRALLQCHVNVHQKDRRGRTALSVAHTLNLTATIRLLEQAGAKE